MRHFYRSLITLSAAFIGLSTNAIADTKTPNVVTTIAPVHSIVANIMEGLGEPYLIIKGAANPHAYNLKPSDAGALSKADLVFWVGPELENFLIKPLENIATNSQAITLSNIPGLRLLPYRESNSPSEETHSEEEHDDHDEHEEHADHDGHDDHDHAHHSESGLDMHIWLSPANALVIAKSVELSLSKINPENKETYANNFNVFSDKIEVLDKEISSQLSSVATKGFLTFHDSFQYFEHHYSLYAMGVISLNPNVQIGAKKMAALRDVIETKKPTCLFAEPQYNDKIIESLKEGFSVGTGTIDPLGANFTYGPDLYFNLMQTNASSMQQCLQNQ